MRLPLKPNRAGWPAGLANLLRASADPRVLLDPAASREQFARAVSVLKFGTTFKQTEADRFPQTIACLASLRFETPPVVLDVGASDGTTSLDVMRALDFGRYYSTDLNNECRVQQRGEWTCFYSSDAVPILAVSPRWVVYPDTDGALPPLGFLARRILAGVPPMAADAQRLALVTPELRAARDPRIELRRYDITQPWSGSPVDILLAANILNRFYFSDQQLGAIIRNLGRALRTGRPAWLAIVDNREDERASIFEVSNGVARLHRRVGAGTDVEALALQALGPAGQAA